MNKRDTKLTVPKTELYHWSDEKQSFEPLSANGGIPVYIVGGEGGSGGVDGKSAYEIAVDNGFDGSIEEWLLSLNGTNGTNGKDGINGKDGTNGKDGFGTEAQYNALVQRLDDLETELASLKE